MINDKDVVLVSNNVDDETSHFSAINRKDDMSSLTMKEKSNICTEYFDTSNRRNYFKNNFEETKKVNSPSYLVGLALCNTSSAYMHISIDEIDMHLVIAKIVKTLKISQKCQFALILNLINEKRINDLSQRIDVNEKDEYVTRNDSELQGCDDKMNCDDIVSPFY